MDWGLLLVEFWDWFVVAGVYRVGGTSPCSTGHMVVMLFNIWLNAANVPFSPAIFPAAK